MNSDKSFIFSPLLWIKQHKFIIWVPLMAIFVFSCTHVPLRSSDTDFLVNHSLEERATLTKFFEELLLEHGGAYTLLGSKPSTIEDLGCSENLKELKEYLASHPEIESIDVERHLEEGWEILKRKPISITRDFILTEVDCESYRQLTFVNTSLALSLMKTHYDEFKRAIGGYDFDPALAIEQLREGKHEVWRRIFRDFVCLGILLGYGLENSRMFAKLYDERSHDQCPDFSASENNDPRIPAECYMNNVPFRLPLFVMFDQQESEELVSKYRQERESIKAFYSGKNFLDVTLEQMGMR